MKKDGIIEYHPKFAYKSENKDPPAGIFVIEYIILPIEIFFIFISQPKGKIYINDNRNDRPN